MSHSLLGFLILVLYFVLPCNSDAGSFRLPSIPLQQPTTLWQRGWNRAQGTWHMAHGTWHVLLAKGSCSATGILLHVKVERGLIM